MNFSKLIFILDIQFMYFNFECKKKTKQNNVYYNMGKIQISFHNNSKQTMVMGHFEKTILFIIFFPRILVYVDVSIKNLLLRHVIQFNKNKKIL